MPNLKYAAICKHVLKGLRNNEAYADMDVNILAIFTYNGERCSIIWVWVPQLKTYVKQYACICFIRPSINVLDKPSEYRNYYGGYIMIYPMTVQEVMIFKYNTQKGGYNVLEIFSNKLWNTYTPIKMEAAKTVIPQSYGDISNLQTILNPLFHNLARYRYLYFNLLLFEYTSKVLKHHFN